MGRELIPLWHSTKHKLVPYRRGRIPRSRSLVLRPLPGAGIGHQVDRLWLNCKEAVAYLVQNGESVVPPPLRKWKPAELALEGRDAASFELALALCPTRSSVLDLVQESSVSLGVWIPYGVTVL